LRVIAAVVLAGPRSRMDVNLEEMIQNLHDTTEKLSHAALRAEVRSP
jgi:DNA-binding IclR family transcriptional regulator